jgi:hypothetical protein
MTLDTIALWNFQRTTSLRAMCESHQHNKLWLFNFIKRLVASNNPLRKVLLESFLIPRSLLNVSSDASN